jgi:hypothetical protein
VDGSRIQYRDVFVYDPSIRLESWHRLEKKSTWKHPRSGHVISKYSDYRYLNSKYSFNNIGEYSLIISPVQPLNTRSVTPSMNSGLEGHCVVIFPDRLVLSNVQESDIPKIMDIVMTDSLTNAETWKRLGPHIIIQQMASPTVVVSSNNVLPFDFVLTVASWFKESLQRRRLYPQDDITSSEDLKASPSTPAATKDVAEDLAILVSNELGGHRNSASVVILPSEDSFEVVTTREKVDDIVTKLSK